MEIYLIRHTQVALEPGICYGQTDVPVANSFETEYDQLRAKLPESWTGEIYSSPLSRCRVLAERLQSRNVQFDARLQELNFGAWELQRWDELDADLLKKWTANIVDMRCPDGESFREQFNRVAGFWQYLAETSHTHVFIVTHGGVIRAFLTFILELPLTNAFRLTVDFGSVTKVHVIDHIPIIDYINR